MWLHSFASMIKSSEVLAMVASERDREAKCCGPKKYNYQLMHMPICNWCRSWCCWWCWCRELRSAGGTLEPCCSTPQTGWPAPRTKFSKPYALMLGQDPSGTRPGPFSLAQTQGAPLCKNNIPCITMYHEKHDSPCCISACNLANMACPEGVIIRQGPHRCSVEKKGLHGPPVLLSSCWLHDEV